GDVDGVDDGYLELAGPAQQGALDLEPRVVARVGGAAVAVRTEEALADAAVGLTRERHAPALEVVDAAGGVAGDDLDDRRVGEEVRLTQGVCGVLLPAVVRVHRAEGRVDAARGEGRVRVVLATLAHGEHLDAALGEFDRGSESRAARADHEHGGGEQSFVTHAAHGKRAVVITPMNSLQRSDAVSLWL